MVYVYCRDSAQGVTGYVYQVCVGTDDIREISKKINAEVPIARKKLEIICFFFSVHRINSKKLKNIGVRVESSSNFNESFKSFKFRTFPKTTL